MTRTPSVPWVGLACGSDVPPRRPLVLHTASGQHRHMRPFTRREASTLPPSPHEGYRPDAAAFVYVRGSLSDQREHHRSRIGRHPQNPAFSGQAAVILGAGRRVLSRLAKQPQGLALTAGSPPCRSASIEPGRSGFVPGFGFRSIYHTLSRVKSGGCVAYFLSPAGRIACKEGSLCDAFPGSWTPLLTFYKLREIERRTL